MKVTTVEKQNDLVLLFQQLRPKQWTKNTLVFAALIFSIDKASEIMVVKSLIGFFLFCLVSSCVYILNDYMDREADRNHPTKRFRPMASGQLNAQLALAVGVLILVFSISTALYISIQFGLLLILYFVINVGYSISLKHKVIIDVMIVASGFVIRAIGGGVIIGVNLTPWFLLCTMLLSLFLAIGKRRHEFILSQNSESAHRKVLQFYNKELLDQMNSIVSTATIMSYSIFTFERSIYLMLTIPFVIYGIFRYLYLIHVEGKGGSPDKLLLEDKHILCTVVLYVVSVLVIIGFE